MSERRRVYYLILIMTIVAIAVAGVAVYLLYRTAFEEQRLRLIETAQSQARLIEAMARHEFVYERVHPEGAEAATLSQIIDAHENYEGFGETGEFTLARREGDSIIFLLSHRHHDLQHPEPVPFESEIAEPMRQALSGNSGSLVGLDYRGELVLAAHEPVAVLNLGIVAKIDMSEVNAPFYRAGLAAVGSIVVIVGLGMVLFFRVSDPMVKRLGEYAEHLEEMVDKRTEELQESQEKLLVSERLATLGQLSGSISHELRNPLSVVDSSVYYLKIRLKDADEKVRQHLDRIKSSVDNSTAIIESLLNLTRMKEPMMAKLDITALTTNAGAASKVPAAVNVIRNFPEKEVWVNADREQLHIVFQNIVKNAVEAMDGKGTLTLTTRRTARGMAEVSFADTGPGVAPENLGKIFQPLFSTKATGIGFGLSIARMIIEKHGGKIIVQSEPEKGTAIIIRLPLYIEQDKEDQQ